MTLMDSVKRAMEGRSEAVEKAVDGALGGFGRLGDSLSKQGERLKSRARDLDGKRGIDLTSSSPPPPPATPEAPVDEVDEGGATAPTLRGDLAP